MIVISNPNSTADEINIIHSLFDEGMMLFHVRKPNFGETEMKQFLSNINQNYRERLVLHSYYLLAKEFNIKRIHISESKRKVTQMLPCRLPFDSYIKNGFHLSTSVHSIEDFNALDNIFEYAFLSPIYPSISKENYFSKTDLFEAVKNRNNYTTQLVALGGIESKNIKQTLKKGFDTAALLGTIWNSNNPIENFKLCQKIALSH
jgi:thiamine-phosphate pyrophosphorylase